MGTALRLHMLRQIWTSRKTQQALQFLKTDIDFSLENGPSVHPRHQMHFSRIVRDSNCSRKAYRDWKEFCPAAEIGAGRNTTFSRKLSLQ